MLKIQEKKTLKGNSYAIVKFSDLSSVFEQFIFSDVFESNREILKQYKAIVWGNLNKEQLIEKYLKRDDKNRLRFKTSDLPPSTITIAEIGNGFPQAAPRTALFPLKEYTGILPPSATSTVSFGQFDAKIINFAVPESIALQACFEPTKTFPVSIATLRDLFRSIYFFPPFLDLGL